MLVFQRFEVVSAPVEERLADSLMSQAKLIVEKLNSHGHTLRAVTNDTKTMKQMAKSAASLVMPGGVPFYCFVVGVFLRVLYVVLVGVRARRLLERASKSRAKEE